MVDKEDIKNKNETVAVGVRHLKILFVNAYFVESPENNSWVLVDTGIPLSDGKIRSFAEKIYGANAKPSAIVLTHGHFDHAGAAQSLAEYWNVPIYAHRLELPYLTGKSDYAPQDPSVGGAIAQMSRLFPHSGYDFGSRVKAIPKNGELAEMPGWKAVYTPGHTNGHVAFFRESDRTLIAGDALATMNMDSWISNITEKPEFCRPAAPFTPDWIAARKSIELIASLEPETVAAGHGQVISGADTAQRLKKFAANFRIPSHGRYINQAAIADENGIVSVPPPVADPIRRVLIGGAIVAGGAIAYGLLKGKRRKLYPGMID